MIEGVSPAEELATFTYNGREFSVLLDPDEPEFFILDFEHRDALVRGVNRLKDKP